MRIFSASLLFIFACSAEIVEQPPRPPVDWKSLENGRAHPEEVSSVAPTQKEKDAAKVYTAALASAGLADLGPALDEEAHFAFTGTRDTHGREDVVKAHDELFGSLDQRKATMNRALLTADSQVVEWTLTGVNHTTHKPVTIVGLAILWTKDDGSITDIHLYFDSAMAKAQAGMAPKALQGVAAPSRTSQDAPLVQDRSPEEKAGTEVVRTAIQSLEDGRETAYLDTMTEDVEVNGLESKSPVRGKTEAKNYFVSLRKSINYLATSIENIWGVKSFVAAEYHILGEQRLPIGWVPVQKEPLMKLSVVDVIEIRDGKIARVWRYDNPIQIFDNPNQVTEVRKK